MPTLHLQDVHLTRGITPVFVSLQLELTEDRIGLIGNNGAGKTSLGSIVPLPSKYSLPPPFQERSAKASIAG